MARRKIQTPAPAPDMFDEVLAGAHEEAPSSPVDAPARDEAPVALAPVDVAPTALETPASMRTDMPAAAPGGEAPKVRRYVVQRDGRLNQNGGVVWLRAGKIVTDTAYSIPLLRAAGIQLAEV